MTTANVPNDSTAARVLQALQPYRLKREPSGQWRADCPWRPGSDSHSLRIKITDGEHGAWNYFAGDGGDSLYDLAKRLNVPLPKLPDRPAQLETSKRTYSGIAEYAEAHGLTADELHTAGISETRKDGRPALQISTANGPRYRFLDDNEPRYKSPLGYTKCWYRLDVALGLCEATGQPLVLCNGEISTLAAQLRGIAAVALAGGTEKGVPDSLVAELQAQYSGEVLIAFDCDPTGKDGAQKVAGQLRDAGIVVYIVNLNGPKGWDLADFVRLPGNDTPEAIHAHVVRETPAAQRRRWLTEDEIELIKPPTWLIKGVVAAGEVTMIAGAGDAGKTFLAVDMMKRVAQHYRVLYVAAEDAPGVGIRKKGWDIHHNRTANGNFLMWHEPFSLFNAEQMDSFITEIRSLGLQMITIDTLSQASVGADENSSNDMGVVMANAQRLAHETGAAVAVLHHNTKDNANYRGSSVIKNNTYGFLEVSKENDVIRLECNRIKNTKSFEPRFFRLIDVATTTLDTEGQPVSTAVIVPAERVLRIGDELTQSEHKMLELVLAATDAMGGITTTELATELQMKGKSFYSPLKRLRDLRFIEKAGDKRTDPLTITPAGRSKMARTDTVNAVQPAGGAAAPLFEVNTNLGELLPLLPLLPSSYPAEKDTGSNPDSRGSNYPVATPDESDDQESCYPVATPDEAASQAVATLATPVATPALGSNGVVTTPPSPPLRGEEGSNSQNQPTAMNTNAVQPAGGGRARGPIQNVGQTYQARREIIALGDPRSLKELALLPEPELYALLDQLRRQHQEE